LLLTGVTEMGTAFHVSSTTCPGASVAVGTTCTIGVTFRPTTIGQFTGVITLQEQRGLQPEHQRQRHEPRQVAARQIS
jgi:hypothetical protein